jgi:hypothetical protein
MRWLLSPESPETLKCDSVMGTGDVDLEYHKAAQITLVRFSQLG